MELPPRLVEVDDAADATRWRFDADWLQSNWTCIWGRGCLGIEATPDDTGVLGCCSVGAELADEEEAMTVAALAATLDPARWQHHGSAATRPDGVFSGGRRATAVVDGACVFLNRAGFAGGAGCALHLAAVDAGESPLDWKPAVCWQLPLRVDWEADPSRDGGEVATVRRWTRADWGDEGETMAWCCTEGERAYVGQRPVVDALADELGAITGAAVLAELRRRLADPAGG
ncbi:MAG TPA: hypothetical protein VFP61_09370 [Acidimicrobiales bacterium]|nr:hypothetical protein [Acidimicrobiales bacterium]